MIYELMHTFSRNHAVERKGGVLAEAVLLFCAYRTARWTSLAELQASDWKGDGILFVKCNHNRVSMQL